MLFVSDVLNRQPCLHAHEETDVLNRLLPNQDVAHFRFNTSRCQLRSGSVSHFSRVEFSLYMLLLHKGMVTATRLVCINRLT